MPVYLDNNATTPPAAEVVRAMTDCLRDNFGNPSSSHPFGQDAKKAVEAARRSIADLIGAESDEIIFTSGGTESNNLAIAGTLNRFGSGHIITSCIEHPSVMNPLRHFESSGFRVTYLPVDRYGIIDPSMIEKNVKRDTILITIMHSNNETGSIQPVAEAAGIAGRRNIVFHCDAAQSVGKVPVNVRRLGVDLMTIVSHKYYGPKGVGALYAGKGTELKPVMFGASHEKGLRPGTENVCSIAGLGTASRIAGKEMKSRMSVMKHLSKSFYNELRKEIPGIKLNGHPSKRLPNTLNVSFPGLTGEVLLERLKGKIAASTGSACHAGTHTPSPVLKAMGLSDREALSAVRFSLGRNTKEADIRKAVKAIVKACRSL